MLQYDIFGNLVEIEDEEEINQPKRITLKEKFRLEYGFLPDKKCKDCKYHQKFEYHYKNYHKCEKLGISNSEATDIRLKDTACTLYEEEK
jgi:hypothetical protein